jgi:hypothetical protein
LSATPELELQESKLGPFCETIPRGMRKNYIPYWTKTLQEAHEKMTKAGQEPETTPSQKNHNNLQKSKAQYLKTKLECTSKSWREKTEKFNMERDTTKLWRLTKTMNDEGIFASQGSDSLTLI